MILGSSAESHKMCIFQPKLKNKKKIGKNRYLKREATFSPEICQLEKIALLNILYGHILPSCKIFHRKLHVEGSLMAILIENRLFLMIKSNLTHIALSNILKDYLLSFQGKKVGKKRHMTAEKPNFLPKYTDFGKFPLSNTLYSHFLPSREKFHQKLVIVRNLKG